VLYCLGSVSNKTAKNIYLKFDIFLSSNIFPLFQSHKNAIVDFFLNYYYFAIGAIGNTKKYFFFNLVSIHHYSTLKGEPIPG